MSEQNKDLHNRLVARDLTEYAGATRAMKKPQNEADNTQEWTADEKERALDRIPIN